MKKTIKKIGLITFLLLLSFLTFNSCSKNDDNTNINEPSSIESDEFKVITQEEYKTLLIDLNIKIWGKLASNPISEIQRACNEKDLVRLMQLTKLSDKEIEDIMNKAIYYTKKNSQNIVLDDCNCHNDDSFANIVNSIMVIQSHGGAEEFFKKFNNSNQSHLKEYDPEKLAGCEGSCVLACLPLGWNPGAWLACWLACTGACYIL